VVFIDPAQLVPRYLITLQTTLPASPSMPNSQEGVMGEALRAKEAKKRAAEEAEHRRAAREVEVRHRAVEEAARQAAELRRREEAVQAEEAVRQAELRRREEAIQAMQVEVARRQAELERQQAELRRPAAVVPPPPAPGDGIVIPPIARGHEEVYRRFVRGRLIYRPTAGSDVGRIDMPIAALANPLESPFDLSRCGDTGQYLSISTGYRKRKQPANASKVETWIAPRFLIERELATTAGHFRGIMGNWPASAPVGLFWTWGGWDDLGWMDYLTTNSFEQIGDNNLYEKYKNSV
jgi:hypothetical protein